MLLVPTISLYGLENPSCQKEIPVEKRQDKYTFFLVGFSMTPENQEERHT